MSKKFALVAIATSVIATSACAYAVSQPRHSSYPAKSPAVSTQTDSSKNTPASTKVDLTPAPSQSAASRSSTPAPTSGGRYLDVQTGACKGIHATDDGCIDRNMDSFQIASMILWPLRATCSGDTATVDFNTLMVTRHYTTGGGGMAVIQVDYNDGTSSPIISLPFTAGGANVQTYSGLSHAFSLSAGSPAYKVRLTAPNSITLNWQPVAPMLQNSCFSPSPSPRP